MNPATWQTAFSTSTHNCSLYLCCVGAQEHENNDEKNMDGRERGKRTRTPVEGERQQRMVKSPRNCRGNQEQTRAMRNVVHVVFLRTSAWMCTLLLWLPLLFASACKWQQLSNPLRLVNPASRQTVLCPGAFSGSGHANAPKKLFCPQLPVLSRLGLRALQTSDASNNWQRPTATAVLGGDKAAWALKAIWRPPGI